MKRKTGVSGKKIILVASLVLLLGGLGFFWSKRYVSVSEIRSGPMVREFPGRDSLNFLVVGDTGTGGQEQWEVAGALEKRCEALGGIDGLILLGDNFYKEGVSDTSDPQWQEKMEKPYGSPCLKESPIFPVLGNHDYRGSTSAQINYTRMNPRWWMPGRFYSVRFGTLLNLVAIDSSFPDFCLMPERCSLDFLSDQLSQKERFSWSLVSAHHPLSSASAMGYTHSGGFLGFVLQKFACDGADGWMAGHAHHMEHRELSGCQSSIFVSGGGGADLYGVKKQEESRFVSTAHGFLQLQVTSGNLNFSFFNTSSELIYSFEKTK